MIEVFEDRLEWAPASSCQVSLSALTLGISPPLSGLRHIGPRRGASIPVKQIISIEAARTWLFGSKITIGTVTESLTASVRRVDAERVRDLVVALQTTPNHGVPFEQLW